MQSTDELLRALSLEEKASLVAGADFWHTQAIPHLGIPAILLADGPHGLRVNKGDSEAAGLNESHPATCFPTACSLAASFDRDLLREVGEALGEEAIEQNVSVVLGPGVNIKRHPLGGRNFEYFSEDPYLAGELAAAMINGTQSKGVGTSLKHFACNNQERARMLNDSIVDERSLREIYLQAFEIAVKKAQPWTVMTSYNKLNGTYASESPYLFTQVLRDEWGFKGLAETDWGATNDRVKAVAAGIDLEMPYSGPKNAQGIVAAVQAGELAEEALDACVKRVLHLLQKAVENPKGQPGDAAAHDALARKAAAQSAVLLKNNGVLPLSTAETWAVIGRFAEEPRYQGSGSSRVNPKKLTSVLDALREAAIPFEYAPGYHLDDAADSSAYLNAALQLAQEHENVLLFVGQPDAYEAEGYDRHGIMLPEVQEELIRQLTQVNPRAVVVLMAGGVLRMPWLEAAGAVLLLGLGGQAVGAAAVDLLSGKVNPSGKLAETFPFAVEDVPAAANFGDRWQTQYRESLFIGYRYVDAAGIKVRFPFGYGLSYTSFEYSDLQMEELDLYSDPRIELSLKVTNTGAVSGQEIVQVYVLSPQSTVFKAPKALRGFAKVFLEAGESKELRFTLGFRDFAYWDSGLTDWNLEPGSYQILVGASSQEIRLSANLELPGKAASMEADLREAAPEYYSVGPGWQPSEAGFRALYGKEIPEDTPQRGTIGMNTTLGDIEHTLIGKLIKSYGERTIRNMSPGDDEASRAARKAMAAMIYDMPLRSMTMNGVPGTVVDGLLDLLRGRVFSGLGSLLKSLFTRKA